MFLIFITVLIAACVRASSALLLQHIPKEQRVADDVSAPHALRLLQQSVEPFQSMTLPPHRRTLHGAGEEVEHRTDGAHMAVDIKLDRKSVV